MAGQDPTTAYRLAEGLFRPVLDHQHTDELIADAAFGNTAAFARLFHFTGTLLGVGEIRFIHLHNALERGDGLHVLESGQYLVPPVEQPLMPYAQDLGAFAQGVAFQHQLDVGHPQFLVATTVHGRAGEVVERFPAMLAQVSLASHP